MSRSTRDRLVAVLDRFCGAPAFHATADADAEPSLLDLHVDNLGPVAFPVTSTQAGRLRMLGAPARYGLGDKTLTDASVRDTWEIPKAAVHAQWGPEFDTILDGMRQALGLPSSCRLRAELHSLLVYERGQFFLPHQDSEKDDAMAATLVVVLPSEHEGGELVIEKNGTVVKRRGSTSALTLTAFYADCRHEVRPVKSGARIALTFNLLLDGGTAQQGGISAAAVDDVAEALRAHFVPAAKTAKPTSHRLAYLLDHEYTERGLSWKRLKGGDADRAALLRAAADQTGYRIMLALTEIQETWETEPERSGSRRGRRHARDDDHGTPHDGPYRLNDLIESSTKLVRWVGPKGKSEKILLDLKPVEICTGTANAKLKPYDQQHEGYMGNYGNTLDRWYRRAALVLFPADREFAIWAEASPAWAMTNVAERAQAGDLVAARKDAAVLAPFWAASVRQNTQPRTLGDALSLAYALEDPDTATQLLTPFHPEHLRIPAGTPLVQLTHRYGTAWTSALLRAWFASHEGHFTILLGAEHLAWYAALPVLCSTLTADGGEEVADTLVALSWHRLLRDARRSIAGQPPRRRDAGLAKLGEPLAALVAAAERCHTPAALEGVVRDLGGLGDDATAWMIAALRAASGRSSGQLTRGFEPVALEAVQRLRARLSRPGRSTGDWSIRALTDCSCPLCAILNNFLTDRTRRVFEWRLAKERRRHVHSQIESAELPVSHETRRQGSPHALVLTKKETLFTDERTARYEDESDLAWLSTFWEPPGPPL